MNDFMQTPTMMTFALTAKRTDALSSVVEAKQTKLVIDTGMAGRPDALNPVELLLAALAACLIKGIERVAPSISLDFESVQVSLTAHRPVDEARIEDISYAVVVKTEADQGKLDLLHKNLMKHGTIYNTVKSGTKLSGTVTAAQERPPLH